MAKKTKMNEVLEELEKRKEMLKEDVLITKRKIEEIDVTLNIIKRINTRKNTTPGRIPL